VELSEQIIAERRPLVQQVTAGKPVPVKKFIFEMLCGAVIDNRDFHCHVFSSGCIR